MKRFIIYIFLSCFWSCNTKIDQETGQQWFKEKNDSTIILEGEIKRVKGFLFSIGSYYTSEDNFLRVVLIDDRIRDTSTITIIHEGPKGFVVHTLKGFNSGNLPRFSALPSEIDSLTFINSTVYSFEQHNKLMTENKIRKALSYKMDFTETNAGTTDGNKLLLFIDYHDIRKILRFRSIDAEYMNVKELFNY